MLATQWLPVNLEQDATRRYTILFIWGTGGPEFKSRRSDHQTLSSVAFLSKSLLSGKTDLATKEKKTPEVETKSTEKVPNWSAMRSRYD